jgi:hypothetical protein
MMTATLRLTRKWGGLTDRDRKWQIDAADGQDIGFWCDSQRWWPMYLAASIKPGLWISLRRK